MKASHLVSSLLTAMFVVGPANASVPGEFSGSLSLESRYFKDKGAYGNEVQAHISIILEPEYVYSWNNDRNVVTFEPFYRWDSIDDNRRHGDIRELSYVASMARVEIRAGISKVFWGVTESQHVVDVINQTDFVENPDGEQKLGQPMLNATFITEFGNIDAFILPYFRERTVSDENGRYRSAIDIDVKEANYIHDDEEKHIDVALRWSHYLGDTDWALSYFNGTDRDPGFVFNSSTNKLEPLYGLSEQVGIELQSIHGDLLAKAELRYKETDVTETHFTSTIGFEYTIYGMYKDTDVGLLYEWLNDTRHENTPFSVGNASFIGSRIAANDTASSETLIGAIFDNDTQDLVLFRLEASTRINEQLSVDLEINLVSEPQKHSLVYQFQKDDYLQLTINTYF